MRLKLTCRTVVNGVATRNWRTLETGELTLGRGAACDWRFTDAPPEMSKLQCRIIGNGCGFSLRDESVNGVRVDGRDLVEGQSVPLRNGSAIRFCDLDFTTEITGEIAPDWEEPDASLPFGDESPSITAILADVAPRGGTVRGALPAGLGNDILEEVGGRNGRPRDPVQAGWAGPPDASPLGTALPDDWNAVPSEASSRTEHMAATSVRMRLPHLAVSVRTEAPDAFAGDARPSPDADAALATLLSAAGLPPLDTSDDPLERMRAVGTALRSALDGLAAMERETTEFLADLGVETSGRHPPRHGRDAMAVGDAAVERLADQRRLHEALRTLFAEWARDFDPRRIEATGLEASSGAASRLGAILPGATDRAAWARYRAAYGAGGMPERLVAALGRQEMTSAAEFEELGSDTPNAGDVR